MITYKIIGRLPAEWEDFFSKGKLVTIDCDGEEEQNEIIYKDDEMTIWKDDDQSPGNYPEGLFTVSLKGKRKVTENLAKKALAKIENVKPEEIEIIQPKGSFCGSV